MNSTNMRAARSARETARPTMARLDSARHPEDAAADIIEGWGATETALRELVGGSSLEGQALVREARQRNLLSLEQGHAVLQFLAANDRVKRGAYQVTSADIAAARVGFREVENAASSDPVVVSMPTPRASNGVTEVPPPTPGRFSPSLLIGALVAVLLVAGLAWYLLGSRSGGSASLKSGVQLYTSGQREKARGAFQKAALDQPESAIPHVYLSRLAREDGDLPTAQREAQTAVKLEPGNGNAVREMGSYLLATGQYALARNFYLRAVQIDPADNTAQGYLGCTLSRMGQADAAARFLNRAGPGPWSACLTSSGPVQPAPK